MASKEDRHSQPQTLSRNVWIVCLTTLKKRLSSPHITGPTVWAMRGLGLDLNAHLESES